MNVHINEYKKNQDLLSQTDSSRVDKNIKSLSTITNIFKFKKLKLIKCKKLDLIKAKKLDLIKTQSFRIDFSTFKAKKAFIYLWKAFSKILIITYFDLECHIIIEIDALGHTFREVLSQITLDQYSSNHITYKDL